MTNNSEISPTTIMRIAYAVYPSFAMLAGMQLDVFTPLKDKPMNAESLARILKVKESKLSPLLYALVSADLLTVEDGIFSNTIEADTFLVKGLPAYMGGLNEFFNDLWHGTLKTAESIRTNEPKAKHDWSILPDEELIKYFRSHHPACLRSGMYLAQKVDFSKTKRLIDVGGGAGGLSIGICNLCPKIEATVADLPQVVSFSNQFISKAGLSDRITTMGVDLINSELEGSYDVAVLRALIQIMKPEHARKILKSVFQALEPGGHIYILGMILDNTRLSPTVPMAFSLIFLNVYEEGGAYTEKQYQDWLKEAGFTDISIELGVTPDGGGFVSARKP
ncbi:MAG: methyltransferase domain-containing protein [Desulfobacteraceae bacterium]|nr:methyltransferase domain-containing protein [Desulfobacteraceae bacterium]